MWHKNETWGGHFAYHRLIPEAFGVFIIQIQLIYQIEQGENRMFLSALQCAFRRTLAIVLAGALTAMSWAQTAAPAGSRRAGRRHDRRPRRSVNYSKPASHFPNPIGPYRLT